VLDARFYDSFGTFKISHWMEGFRDILSLIGLLLLGLVFVPPTAHLLAERARAETRARSIELFLPSKALFLHAPAHL